MNSSFLYHAWGDTATNALVRNIKIIQLKQKTGRKNTPSVAIAS